MRVLVAGSTGMVGGEAACLLAARGDEVRGLVRRTSDESNVAALRASGVTVVEGDLRDGQSLTAVCRGVDAVVKTVSAMPFSRKEGNTIGDVDRDGTIRLIDAAKQAGVKRFVHTSFPHEPEPTYRLGEAKVAAERHLARSGMEYTSLAANYFQAPPPNPNPRALCTGPRDASAHCAFGTISSSQFLFFMEKSPRRCILRRCDGVIPTVRTVLNSGGK